MLKFYTDVLKHLLEFDHRSVDRQCFFLCLCRLPTVSAPRCRTWVRAAWSWYRMLGRFRVTPRTPTPGASSRTTPAASARRSPLSSRPSSPAPAAHRLVSTPQAPSVVSLQIWTPPSCLPRLELCVLREMTALLVTGKIVLIKRCKFERNQNAVRCVTKICFEIFTLYSTTK